MGLSPDWKGSCCPTAISSVLIRTEVLNQSSYKQHNLIVNCCFRSSEHLKYSVWAVPKYGKCFLFFFVICALWKQLQVTLIKAWNCTRQLAVCYVVMNYFLAFLLVVLKCTSLFHERHFHMSRQEKHRFNKNINDFHLAASFSGSLYRARSLNVTLSHGLLKHKLKKSIFKYY